MVMKCCLYSFAQYCICSEDYCFLLLNSRSAWLLKGWVILLWITGLLVLHEIMKVCLASLKGVFKMYCYDTRITILQFIPALQGLGIMNGITGGWTTHLRQKIWNIHLIYLCLLIEVIRSCVRLFAATSPRHIGKHYSWSFLFICV